ncbi:MAG: ATP synthase F1 subunit epsilon [Bacteroidetes bacterium]|nr:ATP synthase F1 subunit epsilon [Bacteroidota bacterium]
MSENLLVEIVSPDGAAFRGEAVSFRAPGVQGGFEILRNHAPMVAATGVGPIYVTLPNGNVATFASSGGFVEVLDNHVIMLAETAEPASDIDVDRAQRAEERAKERLDASQSPEERAEAKAELEKARNRLRAGMGKV